MDGLIARFTHGLRVKRFPPAVKKGEDRRHKHKRGYGGAEQATDHGTSQRRVLLTAIAKPKRHGNHADNHGQGSHNDRTESRCPCLKSRHHRIAVVQKPLFGEGNDENAVGCCNSHAHDGSH